MFRVFLSHTSEFREFGFVTAAEDAVLRARGTPTDMRYFTVQDQQPAAYCVEQVEQADVYVGIIGFRYSSPVRDRPDVSYTELELDTATRLGIPRLMFLLDGEDPAVPIPPNYLTDREHGEQQERFRRKIANAGTVVTTFATPDQLGESLLKALLGLHKQTSARADTQNRFEGHAENVVQARDVFGDIHFHGSQREVGRPWVEDSYGDVFDRFDAIRFTERPWLTDRIDAFLTEHPKGYFFIEGKTGVGKTTLMAQLTREHGYPHHFLSGEKNRRTVEGALRSLGNQLVARYELEHLHDMDHLGSPLGFRKVLGEAATVAQEQEHRLVLLVHGLDQADEHEPMPLGLPVELPDNAYIIAALREGVRLFHRQPPFEHVRIDPHAEESLDDIRRHIDQTLRADQTLRTRVTEKIPADEFRETLARHCSGVWILLRHLLDDVRAGRVSPDSLPSLPDGLWTYYSRTLDELGGAASRSCSTSTGHARLRH